MNPERARKILLERIKEVQARDVRRKDLWKSIYNQAFINGYLSPKQMAMLERAENKHGTSAPNYFKTMKALIVGAPGYESEPLLVDMLAVLNQGRYLTDREEQAVERAAGFLTTLRKFWLDRLKDLARQYRGNEAVFSVLVDIGVRLKNTGKASPTPEDMEILESMLPKEATRDLISMAKSRARMACKVARLFLARVRVQVRS